MKILIPTAKDMNFQVSPVRAIPLSDKSKTVLASLSSYSAKELAHLYKISQEKAEVEFQRIQALVNGQAEHYPALFLFDGLMYRHIKRQSWSKREESYVKEHLYLTSSLYGVIPALRPIAPHRLDFAVKVRPDQQSLKQFWQQAYGQAVAEDDYLLSLLSSEFEEVFPKEAREKMLRFKFMEEKNGDLKVHSTISKKARGQFLTCLIEQQIKEVNQIKELDMGDFRYQENLSSEQEFVFIKKV